jgi:hypothetical protein
MEIGYWISDNNNHMKVGDKERLLLLPFMRIDKLIKVPNYIYADQ